MTWMPVPVAATPTTAGIMSGADKAKLDGINVDASIAASLGTTATVVKTAAYNAAIGDLVKCDPSAGGFTVTLPTAVAVNGKAIIVKNTTTSTNAITVATTAAQTIDGAATYVMNAGSKQACMFVSDGANWVMVTLLDPAMLAVILRPRGSSLDDQPQIAAQLAAGRAVSLVDAGSFTAATACTPTPSGSTLKCGSNVLITSTIPTTGILDAAFVSAVAAGSTNVGTIASDVVVNSRTVVVSLPTKPTVGSAIDIGNGTPQHIYDVIAVSGVASPYTITVDRPIVFPFLAAGSLAQGFPTYPRDVLFDGNGCRIVGIGKQAVECGQSKRLTVRGVHYAPDGTGGCVQGSPFGFDCACQESLLDDCSADGTNNSAGFYFQSNERSIARRFFAKNIGSHSGLFDCYQCRVEDSWAYNTTNAAPGVFAITRIAAGTFGCLDCSISGGGAIGCAGYAVLIDGAARTRVSGFISDKCGGGFVIGQTYPTTGTRLTDVAVFNSTAIGLAVDANADSTFVEGFQADYCNNGIVVVSGATNTYARDVRIEHPVAAGISAAADLTIDGFVGAITTGDGTGFIQATAGNFTLRGAHITSSLASANVIQVSGGTARISDTRIEIPSGNNTTGIYLTGGTTYLERVTVAGFASSFSLYVASGATCYIGLGCDFGTLGTPFTIAGSGVVYVAQGGEISKAVTTSDVTLTFTEGQAAGITTTGILTGAHNVIVPTVAGMAWDVFNNNTGAFTTTFKTAAGTGIVVAQGKRARLKCDGTNVVRVTADT